MLAYILWHRARRGNAVRTVYEASLLAFHDRLRTSGIEGFLGSSTHGVSPLPWLTETGCHEDWYTLSDWTAIGTLCERAVSGMQKTAHDLAALSSVVEAGALYKLQSGEANLEADTAVWFSKPDTMAYWVLSELLEPYVQAGCGIWQRQLALGPSPEFCLLGPCDFKTDQFTVIHSQRTRLTAPRNSPILH